MDHGEMTELDRKADEILIKTGGLVECERLDGGVYDPLDPGGVEDAIHRYTELSELGEIFCTEEEWESKVKRRVSLHGEECPYCPDPAKD